MNLLRAGLWIVVAAVRFGVAYLLVYLPWQLRRGTTSATLKRSLPGDELVANPKAGYTQAIIIKAPRAEVWHWLASAIWSITAV